MAVSIQNVASRAGVSKAAVSMALRNNPRISDVRRKEIHKIAYEMGYEPNILARALGGGRTKTVGILWGLMGGPHSPVETAQKIAMSVQFKGYVSSIADSSYIQTIEGTLSEYAQRQVDAVILQWPVPEPLSEALVSRLKAFHAVVVVTLQEDASHFDQVIQDRVTAMQEVAIYVKKTNRSNPLIMIAFPPKLNSYIKAFAEQGIVVSKEAIIREAPQSLDSFWTLLDERVDLQCGRPDVIICNNDEEAMAAIAWVRAKGLLVPDDIAVIGFNNSRVCKFMAPPLASVARDDKGMVNAIERMLFARLQNSKLEQQKETIPMRFVWRESAGCPVS